MFEPQWQTKTPMRGASPATSVSGGYFFAGDVPRGGEAAGRRRGGRCLRDGVGDVLRLLNEPTDEDARAGRLERAKARGAGEARGVKLDPDVRRPPLRVRLHPDREHDHVELLVVEGAVLVLVRDQQVAVPGTP